MGISGVGGAGASQPSDWDQQVQIVNQQTQELASQFESTLSESHQLMALYNETNDPAKRQQLGEKIKSCMDELKNIMASAEKMEGDIRSQVQSGQLPPTSQDIGNDLNTLNLITSGGFQGNY